MKRMRKGESELRAWHYEVFFQQKKKKTALKVLYHKLMLLLIATTAEPSSRPLIPILTAQRPVD